MPDDEKEVGPRKPNCNIQVLLVDNMNILSIYFTVIFSGTCSFGLDPKEGAGERRMRSVGCGPSIHLYLILDSLLMITQKFVARFGQATQRRIILVDCRCGMRWQGGIRTVVQMNDVDHAMT